MFILRAENAFDSAHFLSDYEGKCRNIHGHRWKVQVEVQGRNLVEEGQNRGMVLDFGELKNDLKEECDALDHSLIFERGTLKEKTIEALSEENFRMKVVDFRPTAENFSKYFYERMKQRGYDVRMSTVYETPSNRASYIED
ncbi:MAG: 6-carboxytetrahydropterin synthase QueD [Clostridia bacterium]|nr:6-carboxytetrahydropterin synthase QueD [Clostridia bacterium]